MNERDYVKRIATAPPEQFARMVTDASREQREVLKAYLGTERFNRIVPLAIQAGTQQHAQKAVVFIPGFLEAP